MVRNLAGVFFCFMLNNIEFFLCKGDLGAVQRNLEAWNCYFHFPPALKSLPSFSCKFQSLFFSLGLSSLLSTDLVPIFHRRHF